MRKLSHLVRARDVRGGDGGMSLWDEEYALPVKVIISFITNLIAVSIVCLIISVGLVYFLMNV